MSHQVKSCALLLTRHLPTLPAACFYRSARRQQQQRRRRLWLNELKAVVIQLTAVASECWDTAVPQTCRPYMLAMPPAGLCVEVPVARHIITIYAASVQSVPMLCLLLTRHLPILSVLGLRRRFTGASSNRCSSSSGSVGDCGPCRQQACKVGSLGHELRSLLRRRSHQ